MGCNLPALNISLQFHSTSVPCLQLRSVLSNWVVSDQPSRALTLPLLPAVAVTPTLHTPHSTCWAFSALKLPLGFFLADTLMCSFLELLVFRKSLNILIISAWCHCLLTVMLGPSQDQLLTSSCFSPRSTTVPFPWMNSNSFSFLIESSGCFTAIDSVFCHVLSQALTPRLEKAFRSGFQFSFQLLQLLPNIVKLSTVYHRHL